MAVSALATTVSQLSSISSLRRLEASTGVPALYFAVAVVAGLALLVFQGWGLRLLTLAVGFCYPLYCTLRALSRLHSPDSASPSPSGPPRLWLIYWLVYGCFVWGERLCDEALSWLPLYRPGKLLFLLWCFLPQSQGCAVLYDVFLRPLLQRHREGIERGVGEVSEVLGAVGAHVVRTSRKASMQYMREGKDLLDKIKGAT